MSVVKCFWLEPTERQRISLRRYEGSKCERSGYGYHNASVFLEERPARFTEERYLADEEHSKDDPRWPTHCACGYAFTPAHEKQVSNELIYRRSDTCEDTTLRDAPPGAMWDAWWMPERYKGADGIRLAVKLPDGTDWLVDGPSYRDGEVQSERGWTREGKPPLVTARPSILTPRYHAFLTNGELRAC